MFKRLSITFVLLIGFVTAASAQQYVLISMDGSQTNHLKAYGVVFNHITDGYNAQWLLNYRGGSFLVQVENDIVRKNRIRNVII